MSGGEDSGADVFIETLDEVGVKASIETAKKNGNIL